MSNESKQFNAIIPESLIKRTKQEAIEHGVALGDVCSEALVRFLSLPITVRRQLFSGKKKHMGRKIAGK